MQVFGTVVVLAAKTTSSDLIDEPPLSLKVDQSRMRQSRTNLQSRTAIKDLAPILSRKLMKYNTRNKMSLPPIVT